MKKFEIFWELPKGNRDMTWADAVGKMAPIDLLNKELPETFQFVKGKKKKKEISICKV